MIDDSEILELSRPLLESLKAVDKDSPFTNKEFNEILMFVNEFKIEYNHFDAMDLKNKHQVKINASCQDTGVQVIQRFIQPLLASAVSACTEASGNENQLQTEVHDVIYKMKDGTADEAGTN